MLQDLNKCVKADIANMFTALGLKLNMLCVKSNRFFWQIHSLCILCSPCVQAVSKLISSIWGCLVVRILLVLRKELVRLEKSSEILHPRFFQYMNPFHGDCFLQALRAMSLIYSYFAVYAFQCICP